MFKSQLQEYTQKAGLSAPFYGAIKEGFSHEPKYKASVTIEGQVFESPEFFGSLKKAEHAAAEVALAALGRPEMGQLHQLGLCKNFLQEYAQKRKLSLPVYSVVMSGEVHSPMFSAAVEIAGVCYNGGKCKTKKEAEIKAARTALVALYADSGTSPVEYMDDQAVDEKPALTALEAIAEPKSQNKRKFFEESSDARNDKVQEEQAENAEVGVNDLEKANGLPSKDTGALACRAIY